MSENIQAFIDRQIKSAGGRNAFRPDEVRDFMMQAYQFGRSSVLGQIGQIDERDRFATVSRD